jgi:hypothetical protein
MFPTSSSCSRRSALRRTSVRRGAFREKDEGAYQHGLRFRQGSIRDGWIPCNLYALRAVPSGHGRVEGGMRLERGGIDIYYVDESMDPDSFALSAIPVPLLREVEGSWGIVWQDHFENVRDWRRRAKNAHGLPVRKELKGSKLASGRGRFRDGKHQYTRAEAAVIMRSMLSDVGFLQPNGIITVVGDTRSRLYGHGRLEALVFALLQRMRTACDRARRCGLVFFDEGHGEYRKLYRKARVFLPTGSSHGGWLAARRGIYPWTTSPRTRTSSSLSTASSRSLPTWSAIQPSSS